MNWSKLSRLFTESKLEKPEPRARALPEAEELSPPSAAETPAPESPAIKLLERTAFSPSSAELENSLLRVENERLKLEIECLNHVSRWLDRNADLLVVRGVTAGEADKLQARIEQLERELQATRALYEDVDMRVERIAHAVSTRAAAAASAGHDRIGQQLCSLRDRHLQSTAASLYRTLVSERPELGALRDETLLQLTSILSARVLGDVCETASAEAVLSDADVRSRVTHALNDQFGLPIALGEEFEQLLASARVLQAELNQAEPRGALVFVDAGVSFDADVHEAVHGAHSTGEVTMTTFPGYRVEDRLFVRPQVRTAPAV